MEHATEHCARCGHLLGVGRFCTSCGHPVDSAADRAVPPGDDWRTGTAERPAVPPSPTQPAAPTPPPPVFETPREPRFPLFADEVDASGPVPSYDDQPAADPPPVPHGGRPRRGALPWLAGAAALLLIAGGGVVLLTRGGDDDEPGRAADSPGAGPSASGDPTTPPATSPTDEPTSDDPPPTPDPGVPPGQRGNVATTAVATTPATATPSLDVTGRTVRYDAENMLDGSPDTAWRMPGKGSDEEIVFELERPTEITEVGLINGYAKTTPGYDGYIANRRVLEVEWVFADGTTVPQTLADGDRGLQTARVAGTVTDTVTLRILKVSRPAKGPAGRDYTAISDVALVGTPV